MAYIDEYLNNPHYQWYQKKHHQYVVSVLKYLCVVEIQFITDFLPFHKKNIFIF
jgi:hypothetical protein